MYGFWWYKPFDVERGTIVICPNSKRQEVETKLASPHRPTRTRHRINDIENFYNAIGGFKDGSRKKKISSYALYCTGAIFSAIHVAAWNWEFPSSTVRILWNTSAVTSTVTALATPLFAHIIDSLDSREEGYIWPLIGMVTLTFLGIVYTISRLVLIVLVFYCFSSMPTSVYETVDWTSYIPHFS
jgi:hypothetical protein